jgi:tripartite-type tricarboxylate transporter receptor subunit TctC
MLKGAICGGMAAVMLMLCVCPSASSQTTRTIRIVVPVAPGGSNDILARLLGERAGQAQGQTMLIENRPGAGGAVGAEAVSRAAPDGNTVLIMSPSFVIIPQLRRLNYDPLNGFESICHLARAPTVIVVNGASPHRTLADLFNAARAKPGDLTLAASGTGTFFHIAFEMLKRAATVNITYVPYSGGAPAVTALLGDHVTSVFTDHPTVSEQLNGGKLRALATGSLTRIQQLAEVPTVAESGYVDYEADNWFGLYAPAKTPKDTISRLAALFVAALQAPETKQKLLANGLLPVGMCGSDFAAYLRRQYDQFGRVIREANIKTE